jgi:hypothetical protein
MKNRILRLATAMIAVLATAIAGGASLQGF